MEGPIQATPEDHESILDLANTCFPKDRERGGMAPRWPHCFRRDRTQESLIIKARGKVVSHVRCVEQRVRVPESTIKTSGISSVGTLPEYRGQGLMTRLLKFSIDHMKKEGYAISDLGGDRLRYGRFGWESAGRAWHYKITPRSMNPHVGDNGLQILPYSGKTAETEGTLRLQRKDGFGVQRDLKLHEMLLSRYGKETWIALDGDEIGGYAVMDRGPERDTIEEMAGTPGILKPLLAKLAEHDEKSIEMDLPMNHRFNRYVRRLSSSWSVKCLRMLRIIDLEKTLKAFSPFIGKRYQWMGYEGENLASFSLEGESQAVNIVLNGQTTRIESGPRNSNTIALSRRKMSRLLFGPGLPSHEINLPREMRFLEGLLPLPIFIWRNEMV